MNTLILPEEIPMAIWFATFGVLIFVIVAGLHSNRVTDKKKFVFWALLVAYMILVICSAVVFRKPSTARYLHLQPFWVYTDFLKRNHIEAVRDIIINLLLFLPLGALLAGINPSLKWYKVLLIGLACSLSIEVLQYALLRGDAQTDDLLHNTVSCLVGWGVVKGVVETFGREIRDV